MSADLTGCEVPSVPMAESDDHHRSGCPINLAIEVLGDRWSLVVLRDVMFGDRHYFRELLAGSQEGIASNILADRLRRLVGNGLLWRAGDATHRQKRRYSLTEAGIQLVPGMAGRGTWGRRPMPGSPELSGPAAVGAVHGRVARAASRHPPPAGHAVGLRGTSGGLPGRGGRERAIGWRGEHAAAEGTARPRRGRAAGPSEHGQPRREPAGQR